jgi:hypothetical protein
MDELKPPESGLSNTAPPFDWDSLIHEDRVHRSIYTDPGIFAAEMTSIFGGTWTFVAHESQSIPAYSPPR